MDNRIDDIDIATLTIDERTMLAHRLWHSVQRELEATPPSAEQIAEIDRRIVEADAGRMESVPWSELKRELLARKR